MLTFCSPNKRSCDCQDLPSLAGTGDGKLFFSPLSQKVFISQLCPTLCDPMDCSLISSSVHGILQARILEWFAICSSRGIFPTQVSNSGILHHGRIVSLPSELLGKHRISHQILPSLETKQHFCSPSTQIQAQSRFSGLNYYMYLLASPSSGSLPFHPSPELSRAFQRLPEVERGPGPFLISFSEPLNSDIC